MFTVHPLHTLFEFIPDGEKEKVEKSANYIPTKFLFIQLDGELTRYYRNAISKASKQRQVADSADSKVYTEFEVDSDKLIALNREIAKKIVKQVTGIDFPELKIVYPVMKDGKLVEEWCTDEPTISKFLDRCPGNWLGDLISDANDLSSLTPYEKKS